MSIFRNKSGFNRDDAAARAKNEAEKADLKQHADKLIQGFENMDDSHSKRAVWELVQNACDLTDQCEITIDFSNDQFRFTHNGALFTSNTLISLVKQVSSKSTKNKNEVGQFGTGFITTHSFGKKFTIQSFLEAEDSYIRMDNFLIDRTAKNSHELVPKIKEQQEDVFDLIKNGKVAKEPKRKTTFSYIPHSEQQQRNIKAAEANLHHYIPYVMALNETLVSVKVMGSAGNTFTYKKGEEQSTNGMISIPVLKNEVANNLYCLRNEAQDICIILPLKDEETALEPDELVARLFLFFPLIGTEDWGSNFIIHSRQFAPKEARDGLYLKSNNEQTSEKESNNRAILERASEMIFSFLNNVSKNAIQEPHVLCRINFDTDSDKKLVDEYYRDIKEKWSDRLKHLPFVETNSHRIAPEDAIFLSENLFKDEEYFDSIYELCNQFHGGQIPGKQVCKKWTQLVNEWENESIEFIESEALVKKISERSNMDGFDQKILKDFHHFLIKSGNEHFFDDYKLLPNIYGDFEFKKELNLPVNIHSEHLKVAEYLMPDIPKTFVNQDYRYAIGVSEYTRRSISKDFNAEIHSKTSDLSKSIDSDWKSNLIRLCSIFPNEDVKSTRREVMPLIAKFYELDYKETFIDNIENDPINYDQTPFKGLVQVFLNDIYRKSLQDKFWVDNNLDYLKSVIVILDYALTYSEILDSYPVFPNQNGVLKKRAALKLEKGFPEATELTNFIKDKYEELFGEDIRHELIHPEFESFVPDEQKEEGRSITSKIESELKEKAPFDPISDHPDKAKILDIITKLTSYSELGAYFPQIDGKKAMIMMSRISDNEVKDDLFSIIGLEDKNKISLLGALSKSDELEKIIELGEKAIQKEKDSEEELSFKKRIGVHLENLIRNRIEGDLLDLKVRVKGEQGGQDIIISYNEEIIHYVEVKSRWINTSSITMSNMQTQKAVENKDCYSLCCIDMVDYNDNDRHQVEDIGEIESRINFIQNIGSRIEPLISNTLSVETEDVHLTDEYRVVVPQKVVKEGDNMDTFIQNLSTRIYEVKKGLYAKPNQ